VGIEEDEDVQAEGIENVFNKKIADNFSNLWRDGNSCTGGLFRTPNK
jgi:hypothetical protein